MILGSDPGLVKRYANACDRYFSDLLHSIHYISLPSPSPTHNLIEFHKVIFISLVFTKYSFLSTVRLCCPQGGVYTNVVTFIFEVFMMAPCLACKWARGKRTPQANSASKKPRYGGTDDLELGDK